MPDLAGEEVTLFFYLTLDDNGKGLLQPVRAIDNMEDASSMPTNRSIKYLGLSAVHGHTDKLGDFVVSFHNVPRDDENVVHSAHLSTTVSSPNDVKKALESGLRVMEDKKSKRRHISLAGSVFAKDDALKRPNLVVHQVTGRLPFQLEVVYESVSFTNRDSNPLLGDDYEELLSEYRAAFVAQFENRFHLVKIYYFN